MMHTETSILLTHRFEEALVYACQLHAQQVRKGSGIPYVSHLLSVAALVLEMGGDEDQAIAALLHDAIEDQGGAKTRTMILNLFGARVTDIVDGCSDCDTEPKPPWHSRKLNYINRLRQASPEVCRVSLADKLHNARSILVDAEQLGPRIWEKFQGGREGTIWYYHSLVEIYQQRDNNFWSRELARIVEKIEKM